MRVSYRWLRELLPTLEASAEEVADRLTAAGLEVEAMHRFGEGLEAVRVAEVTRVEAHPSRDRLRLVTVSLGAGEEPQRVVCGAGNVPEPGGLVALASVGTALPAIGLTLTPRAIGGVESAGMLCSEAELGLAEGSEGILVLPEGTARPGTPLPEALPAASDVVYELGVTPNRPDALGHVGVARDVAALLRLELPPLAEPSPASAPGLRLEDLVSVDNQEGERCPHYGAAVVVDVRVGPSPSWLRWRLHSLGVRPISNVVDITNLLLLEHGQPMHAFDLDLVRGSRIVIRRARSGEPFTTLDGVARILDADDLVICDGEGPVALAGVMGGENSEIRAETRRVLLECAYFRPQGIRRTVRRHGLHTESSFRFERGVDWAAVPRVLERAKALLVELSSGAAVDGALHRRGAELRVPRIRLRSRRLDGLLGVPVPFEEATDILQRLGLEVSAVRDDDGDRTAEVSGASWRPDIGREADLIEEVARVRGYDGIPERLPALRPQPPRTTGKLEREASEVACSLGLSEAVAFSFVSPRELEALRAPPPVVVLRNPLTEERSVMRTSLLPGLLEAVRRARRRGEPGLRLFSVGGLFLAPGGAPPSEAAQAARPALPGDAGTLPEERPAFAAVLAGPRPAHLRAAEEVDVLDAKGVAFELVERMTGRVPDVRSAASEAHAAHLHPRGAGALLLHGRLAGRFGPLHPDVLDALDVGGSVQVVEIDLAVIEAVGRKTPRYRPIPRLPAVVRDIALVVGEDTAAGRVQETIRAAAGDLCESVELFDVFSGGALPAGQRSLAFRVVYRDPKAASHPDVARTLTDKEVDERHERVRAAARELGQLRG